MSEKEKDREQLETIIDKLDNWNAEFEKSEVSFKEDGAGLTIAPDE